ncbi:MAG: hypothetical protein IKF52_06655 [Clostridia bacterium]|nr:hypothetical protein [Clostridia bacterium]
MYFIVLRDEIKNIYTIIIELLILGIIITTGFLINSIGTIDEYLYKESNQISEVGMSYTVTLNDGSSAPTYYWTDGSGANLGTSMSGTLSYGTKQSNTHKICFVNYGEQEISKNIKFNVNSVQINPNAN